MDNSGLNVVGEHLGYDWNQVCDAVGQAEYYAEDGDGSFTVQRSKKNDYSSNAIINAIMVAIFEQYPHVNKVRISN